MDKNKFRKIGSISKVNRKTGEATVYFGKKNTTLNQNPEVIFLDIDGGLVPFYVLEISAMGPENFRVLLEDYNSPEQALQFVGCKVFLPLSEKVESPAPDEIDFNEIIGFSVQDENAGPLGEIADVFESPDQVILQIFKDKKEILIPLVDEYVVEINMNGKYLSVDLPDGLLDLYLNE